jgi:hypothetical protein
MCGSGGSKQQDFVQVESFDVEIVSTLIGENFGKTGEIKNTYPPLRRCASAYIDLSYILGPRAMVLYIVPWLGDAKSPDMQILFYSRLP